METVKSHNNKHSLKQDSPESEKSWQVIKKESENRRECSEEPIDLTFTQKNDNSSSTSTTKLWDVVEKKKKTDEVFEEEAPSNSNSLTVAKIIEADHLAMKKRNRKRKSDEEIAGKMMNIRMETQHESSEYLQHMDQKQAEVLKAAKSLFSKRTRTLYHWMYPNTPKSQLKAAVLMSWETLGVQEKEFYISQVLGRFGFPQNSLMINPQLDGIRIVPQLLQLEFPTSSERKVIRPVMLSESWSSKMPRVTLTMQRIAKKRAKLGRPNITRRYKDDENAIKQIQSDCDDFQDDPELSREFEQFKWNLHMNEHKS